MTNSPFVCGARISASSTTPVIMGLSNKQQYTIAVAAYDEVNNIGPLSVLQCATPVPTDTFFPQYCKDGGAGCAGCGSCAVGAPSDLTWPGLALAALAALGLIVRRDERRRPHPRRSRKGLETE